jgi:hypothetical protein
MLGPMNGQLRGSSRGLLLLFKGFTTAVFVKYEVLSRGI